MTLLVQKRCRPENICFSIPLEKRLLIRKSFSSAPFLTFLFIILAFYYDRLPFLLSFLLFFILPLIFVSILHLFYYQNYFYNFENKELVIKRFSFKQFYYSGIRHEELSFPYSKIKNVVVKQKGIDKFFKLYNFHFEVIDPISEVHIDGFSEDNSNKIRNILLGYIETSSNRPANF